MRETYAKWLGVIRFRLSLPFGKTIMNVGWLFFDRMFRLATGMLVGVWLARYLGPEQYGLLNYIYVFPMVLSSLASLGVNNILINEIPIQPQSSVNNLVRTTVNLKLLSGFLAFVLVGIVNYTVHAPNQQLILLVTISSVGLVLQCFDAVDVYYQSVGKVYYSVLPKIIAFGLATIARVYGLTAHYHLLYFVFISACELFASYTTIYLLYLSRSRQPFLSFVFDINLAKKLLKLSWPLMFSEFFIFLYTRIDQLMLEYLVSSRELGKYSAALRLSEVWYFAAGAITMSFYPSIIILRKHDYVAYLNRYQRLLNLLAVAGIAIGLLFTFLAKPITILIYGDQYSGVSQILSIHIWTGLFVFMAVGTNNWFVVENMQRFFLWRTINGALINVLLNFVLIPIYGAVGASLATLLAQIFAAYLTNGILKKTQEVFQLQTNALLFIPRYFFNAFCRFFYG